MKLKDLELLRRNALAPARTVLEASRSLGLGSNEPIEGVQDRPAILDPKLAPAVSIARADLIAVRAGLGTRLRERLAKAGVGLSSLDTRGIDQLVDKKLLPKSKANAFREATASWQLVDANDTLFLALPSTDPDKLAALDGEQWHALLKDIESPLETGAHAAYLERKTANWFPSHALSARLGPGEHPAAQVAVGLAGDVLDGLALHQAGYASPRRLARAKPRVVAQATGLSQSRIQSIQQTAQSIAGSLGAVAGSIAAELQHGPDSVGSPSGNAKEWFAELPGFEDLFGGQSFCSCEECASILGAAAYFVDLMRFVDENITQDVFAGRDDHPLNLRTRRPDLWELQLSCENVNTLLPTLQIVVEVLETVLLQESGSTLDSSDRDAVESQVYGVLLPAVVDSFGQPHNLPVTEIQTLLGWWESSLGQVSEALLMDREVRGRLALNLSPEAWDVLVTPELGLARLNTLYGVDWGTDFDPVGVQDLLRSMGVTREELGRLLDARFLGGSMHILSEKLSADSLQNDVERLHDASASSLDRLHRFVRLQRASQLSIEALDLSLSALDETGRGTDIDAAGIADIAELLSLSEELDLSIEETICLWAPLPEHPSEAGGSSMLDRLFNLDRFVSLGGAFPVARTYTHPSLGPSTDLASALDHARLLAATGTDEAGLERLVLGLAEPLGMDIDSGSVAFTLDRDALSLLMRHAILSRALDLALPELLVLLELADGPLVSPAALRAALDLFEWTQWSLETLQMVTGAQPLDAETAVEDMVVELESSLGFESGALAVLEGLTQAQASSFLEDLDGAQEQDGLWFLNGDFDYAAVPTPPAESTVDPAELLETLLQWHATSLLRTVLPKTVDCTAATLDGLLAVLDKDLAGHQDALMGGERSELESLTRALWRLSLLLADSTFQAETLLDLAADPSLLSLSDPSAPTLQDAQRVASYIALQLGDTDALHAALAAWNAGFNDTDPELLGAALESNSTLAHGLAAVLPSQGHALFDLSALQDAVRLAESLGLAADAMINLTSTSSETLANTSGSLLAALRSANENDQDFEDAWEPLRDSILGEKRDALVAWLIHSGARQFEETKDLYDAYLLDVQVSGCAGTSRIVQATNSLQLYVQRIMLGLERSPENAPDPVTVDVDLIPEGEWDWRRQFRLWQANRLIFLFPESYLLPSLRDNKTALFEQIESQLLSSDITEKSVTQAYASYLAGFEEIAKLQIGGVCREVNEDERTDVLHLFATTTSDPPRWYYRRVENTRHALSEDDRSVRWRAWEPMELKIPGREVSPIVHKGRLHLFWHRYETKPVQDFEDGDSKFRGYRHQMRVEYARLQADESWSAPQELTMGGAPFEAAHPGVIDDPMVSRGFETVSVLGFKIHLPDADKTGPLYAELAHAEPIDNYTLRGVGWDRIHVSRGNQILLRSRDFQTISPVDLYTKTLGEPIFQKEHGDLDYGVPAKDPVQAFWAWLLTFGGSDLTFSSDRILWSKAEASARGLYYGDPQIPLMENEVWAALHARQEHVEHYASTMRATPSGDEDPWWNPVVTDYIQTGMKKNLVGRFDEDKGIRLLPITGSPQDMVIAYQNELFLLQDGARADGRFHIQRLGTSLADGLSKTLFTEGVEGLLSLDTQLNLGEETIVGSTGLPPFKIDAEVVHDASNSGKVAWTGPMGVYLREIYLHLPMLLAQHLDAAGAYEEGRRWWKVVFDPTATAHNTDSDETQRAWRYREFRELTPDTLRQRLTEPTSLADYAEDPFNPHAIARTRLTAYQKACVYGYVDNLVGTGDALFTQDTRESVAEATLYYVMAESVLGKRPAQVGDCGETAENKNYGELEGKLGDSELLVEIERWLMGQKWKGLQDRTKASRGGGRSRVLALQALRGVQTADIRSQKEPSLGALQLTALLGQKAQSAKLTKNRKAPSKGGWSHGEAFASQLELVFCVPHDDKMLARWGTVADRLYKLRNCMDINGVRRQLALFAPFIDPMLLARAAALGLDLGDVVSGLSSGVPPLRFPLLLELARRHTGLVQSFGNSLYAALERRDAQELAQLQQLHQADALALGTKSREQQLEAAQYGVAALEQRIESAQARLVHYESLLESGLNGLETGQAIQRIASAKLRNNAATLGLAASVLRLIPNLGSPTAITFGGKQLGASLEAVSAAQNGFAGGMDSNATAMGLFASWARRVEGWNFSKAQVEREIQELEPQLAAAELRAEIAERSLSSHTQRIEQVDEVLDLFESRFTNGELLDWRAQQLQSVFREAWQVALTSAQMAQAAYHFERADDSSFLSPTLWDASRAGLLCGERLQLALARMEQRYAQSTSRRLEISQTLALSQVDPEALIELRETGLCEFSLSERHFDLQYPGHFARRLRAVRLTLPCVTGPYTSVSATLTLLGSHIRSEPTTGDGGLEEVSVGTGSAVSTSTAQGDAGVFELSFRSERYLPFEGAGAVSQWRLELPKRFKVFDYRSITDVLVDLSYEADSDGVLRESQEAEDGVLASTLRAETSTRILSLRQDFSATFQRLMRAVPGTEVDLELSDRHLPGYLQNQGLTLDSAEWILVADKAPGSFSLSVDGSATSFTVGSDYGGLHTGAANLSGALRGTRTLTLDEPGDLGDATGSWAADPDQLHDLLLVLRYTVD